MRALVAAIVVAAVGVPAVASAQRWGRERFPQAGACFYERPYFEGDYFCVRAGDEVPRLPDELNDEISSILVLGPAEVVIYEDSRFRGRSERFDYSLEDLDDYRWDDRISSMRVGLREPPRPDRFGDLNDADRGRDRDRRGGGQNADRIVRRAYQDILGRDPDDAGLRQYRSRIIDDGWTEEQVRGALRTSPEFQTVRRRRAEDIVRSAYRAVLNRDPDSGAEPYIQNVLRENWTQQDVERALRNSAEFRSRR